MIYLLVQITTSSHILLQVEIIFTACICSNTEQDSVRCCTLIVVCLFCLPLMAGGTKLEWLKLQKEKVTAMEMKDTLERLNKSIELVKNNISTVAAKLAIQSVL